jgi:hypothetical protein
MGPPRRTAPGGGTPDRAEKQPDGHVQRLAERERLADLRERDADERERIADLRDRDADERERVADERELMADQREQRLGERAMWLRQRSRELRQRTTDARERAAQAVEAATAALKSNSERTSRAEAALDRAHARASRERASADRARKVGELHPDRPRYDFSELADRVSELRHKTAAAAVHLAESEEAVARVHEELAAREPGNAEHQRVARDAGEAARRAREIERRFSGRGKPEPTSGLG